MWRAGSGDGHYMEWREFHGGSAAPTQRQASRPFVSARVSLQPTESVQSRLFRKTCVRPLTSLSIFIGALRSALRFEFDEFGSSMTRYFKRNMWRAGSGDGYHMEWREFHGGSAAPTQRQAARPFISARVSFATSRGCSISTLQKNLRETADKSFHFHRCTTQCATFWIWWIWVKYDKIFHKKHVKGRKWRWTSYGMKRISWRLGGRHHTQRPALKPFISAHVSLQQQCGCTIDLDSWGIRQR